MSTQRRGGLGRGLAALIPQEEVPATSESAHSDPKTASATVAEVPVTEITANPRQPREAFDDDELEGLATSLRDVGMLQPLVVRRARAGGYELVAGERRLRAAFLAGFETVPVVVRHTEDADLLKEALVENIHRVQLNPLEEAAAYQQLLDEFGFSQQELARRIGKSRPVISNTLRLLGLPPAVQSRVAAGVLSSGHAKALLALGDRGEQERVAQRIIAEGLSVRATEELVRLRLVEDPDTSRRERSRSSGDRSMAAPGLVELQDDLSDALMARVRITMGRTKGRMEVEFTSIDDLERIVGIIANGLSRGGSGDAVPVEADLRRALDDD